MVFSLVRIDGCADQLNKKPSDGLRQSRKESILMKGQLSIYKREAGKIRAKLKRVKMLAPQEHKEVTRNHTRNLF